MINTDYFKGKKVTVIGLARSGLCVSLLLSDVGAEVRVTDCKDDETCRCNAQQLISRRIPVELGKHSAGYIEGADLAVLSPGIPQDAFPVRLARARGIPVISEIEVGWILCPAPIIAVTGANGKTTVTTLIGEVLRAAGKKAVVCGNIGNPFCGEVGGISSEDYVSLEVSSFQLETIDSFKPVIGVLLNITPNHLDRYAYMDAYIAAKQRIFINQDASCRLVLNRDDAVLRNLAEKSKAPVVFFRGGKDLNPNQAAVMAVAGILGIEKEICFDVFRAFKGIEHRMEQVAEINNIVFINDSKATTVDSALWALNDISCPVVWIAGGRHKGIDYSAIVKRAEGKVKHMIVIGEAKAMIRKAVGNAIPTEDASSLEEAVIKSIRRAAKGDCVLFSPMCSSYDMFRDYEERGRVFKKIVMELSKAQSKNGIR